MCDDCQPAGSTLSSDHDVIGADGRSPGCEIGAEAAEENGIFFIEWKNPVIGEKFIHDLTGPVAPMTFGGPVLQLAYGNGRDADLIRMNAEKLFSQRGVFAIDGIYADVCVKKILHR